MQNDFYFEKCILREFSEKDFKTFQIIINKRYQVMRKCREKIFSLEAYVFSTMDGNRNAIFNSKEILIGFKKN